MIKLQQVGGMFTMISDKELERRRSSAQRIMRDKGADCVLTVAFNTAQGSGVRYFADFPANDYGSAVILPAEGGLTYMESRRLRLQAHEGSMRILQYRMLRHSHIQIICFLRKLLNV